MVFSLIYRVLVVDDYEPWRRHVCSELEKSSHWRVVGTASDGVDAVQKVRALRPDLILLDVALPSVTGIEAASRILSQNPTTRILFVSQDSSPDIVKAALDTGASGYVLKSDAGRELLAAMDTIVKGGHFVGARLARPHLQTARAKDEPKRTRHEITFCADEQSLLDDYSRTAQETFANGNTFVILAGASRIEQLEKHLKARRIDVDRAAGEGRYHAVDSLSLLAAVMVDGLPDESRFLAITASFSEEMSRTRVDERARVIVCGECAPTLLRQGNWDAAIQLEHLWDRFVQSHNLETFCYYLSSDGDLDDGNQTYRAICAAHTAVHSR